MRIAQILNSKAHWIFESDEMPNYPPDQEGNPIILINITDLPEVQEGWDYNFETSTFTKPIPAKVDSKEVVTEDFKLPITNEDLMDINLLHMMITLEDIELKRKSETINKSSSIISNSIVKGWSTLVLKQKVSIDNLPKAYKKLVLKELENTKNNQ